MKNRVIWILVMMIFVMTLLMGCERQAMPENAPTEATLLTEDELAYFNGDLFFNGGYLNIRNQFLSSLYDKPADIDLFQLFYCGSGIIETITEGELKAVIEKSGMPGGLEDIPCPCEKISGSNMDEVLTKYMGITLADTNEVGLDNFVYLPEYNAYYFFHGDTNYRGNIQFSSGERKGDTVRLFYTDNFFGDGNKALTLQEKNGAFLFVANRRVASEIKDEQPNIDIPMQTPFPKENQFEVMASDQISEWKKLKASVILHGLDEGGSVPLDDSKVLTYFIHYPGTWNFDGSSVFYDDNNKKIAEFPPAVLLNPDKEAAFLENKPDMNWVDKLISQQKIQVNSYQGSQTIIQITTESGSWYPHEYRLSDGTCGFRINFYSNSVNDEDQKLFDKIVNTFQILSVK